MNDRLTLLNTLRNLMNERAKLLGWRKANGKLSKAGSEAALEFLVGAARMIMGQLSDIGLQYADNVAITEPNEAGSFAGDTWFGHPYKRTLGTHQWDGQRWRALLSETDAEALTVKLTGGY